MKRIFIQIGLMIVFSPMLTGQTEKVGIGTTTPEATLDVNGDIKIGGGTNQTPAPGTVRWNDETGDFEGFDGNTWKSLTQNNSFGNSVSYQNQSLAGNSGASSDDIGFSVAISGSFAVVGDPFDDEQGENAGAAWVYELVDGSWSIDTKLLPDDGDANDNFGWSVDISGDFIIVGAPDDEDAGTEAGSAYIFYNFAGISWIQPDKLLASDPEDWAHFGESVSISTPYAIVGSPDKDLSQPGAGAAYIFKKDQFSNNFSETAQFQPIGGDANENDFFGRSVDISGTRALIGAYEDDEAASNAGAAYIFEKTIGELWSQVVKLTASDAQIGDRFGESVSLYDNSAIIGAFPAEKAYVFNSIILNVWNEQAILQPSVPQSNSRFGRSVAISDNIAIIGAEFFSFQFGDQGSAFIFERTGGIWTETSRLVASDPEPNDWFGRAVAIDQGNILIGAPQGGVLDRGIVYFFW